MEQTGAMQALRLSRIQNFKNIITGQGKVDHIPHFGNFWSWKYYDAGYPLSEVLFDYDKMYDAIDQFYRRYPMDVIYETGRRNPVQVTDMLGRVNGYTFNDEQYSISIQDQCFMEDDDYEALIANPKKYLWEIFLPRKYTVLKNGNSSVDFRKFYEKFTEFGQKMGAISQQGRKYGIADFRAPNAAVDSFGFGYELLFNFMRGMKNLSIDLRRRPEQVLAACQAIDAVFALPLLEKGYQQPAGSNPEYCVDLNPVMLGHILLSPKQFERYYWPHLKRMAEYAEKKDKLVLIHVEGSAKTFWDFFREFPKNRFAILSEADDIREQKAALPNCVMAGGMPAALLGSGTPEQCVAKAAELVDEIGGSDHRFIFSEDKMVSFPCDCKRENLTAVCNYLRGLKF